MEHPIPQRTRPTGAIVTRRLAGVSVPDTPLVDHAIALAREHSEPWLFNHAMRSWLFAAVIAELRGTPHDAGVLAVATLLHDIGLTQAFDGPLRFAVEGANAPRRFALGEGFDERRSQLVWDGVALNSTPSIGLHKEAEVSLCTSGIGFDWGGFGYETLTETQIGEILEAYPRLEMKERFTRAVCGIVAARPATTWDNFARDFGERFVPGYERPSTVDLLFRAPFAE